MNELTVSDLHKRWAPISRKTVYRHIELLGLKPFKCRGLRPVFKLEDVLVAEAKRDAAVLKRAKEKRVPIISINKARRIAAERRQQRRAA